MFQTNAVTKIEAHILCSETFSFDNRAVYEIMWEGLYRCTVHFVETFN